MSTLETAEEIETALIGCFLLDFKTAQDETADFALRPDMFTGPAARTAYEAMLALAASGHPVDALTVLERLKDRSVAPFLDKSQESAVTVAHAGYYGQLLALAHSTRTLKLKLARAMRRLDEDPPDLVQADLIGDLSSHDAAPSIKSCTMRDADTAAVAMFQKAAEGKTALQTGFPFLDKSGGFQKGSLVVISGKAGSCKTTLARQILTHVAGTCNIPVALITLEMSESQIAGQSLTDLSQTSYGKFMRGASETAEWDRLFIAKAKADNWPLTITAKARTPAKVQAFTRAAVRRGAQLVVLDYLQALSPDPAYARANIEQQTSYASNTIRDLAVTLDTTFIVVCTESREGELRYSDAIRYDAWIWLRMIQPEENNKDNPVFHLEVKKNRFGHVPKQARVLYRVGDRLLTDTEWDARPKK